MMSRGEDGSQQGNVECGMLNYEYESRLQRYHSRAYISPHSRIVIKIGQYVLRTNSCNVLKTSGKDEEIIEGKGRRERGNHLHKRVTSASSNLATSCPKPRPQTQDHDSKIGLFRCSSVSYLLFENNTSYVKQSMAVSYSYLLCDYQPVSPSPTPPMDGR